MNSNTLTLEQLQKRSARVQKMISSHGFAIGCTSTGCVISSIPNNDYHKYAYLADFLEDVTEVACGSEHAAFLLKNGQIYAGGSDHMGQCNVGSWKNIVSVACGRNHVIGIQGNGQVRAVGMNGDGQCNVTVNKPAIQASAGQWHTAILHKDGTVTVRGVQFSDTSHWHDIVATASGCEHIVGLKKDGHVVMAHKATCENDASVERMEKEVSQWRDIISVAAYDSITLGLKADGTVLCCGKGEKIRHEISTWRDVVAIDVGQADDSFVYVEYSAMAVKADGTVLFAGGPRTEELAIQHGEMYPPRVDYKHWRLFNSVDTIDEEYTQFVEEREAQARAKEMERQAKIQELENERKDLNTEFGQTRWLLDGKRRKEIKERIAVIEIQLSELRGG